MKKAMLLTLVVVGLFAVGPGFVLAEEEKADTDRILDLGQIRNNPDVYITTSITFRGQFHKMTDVYNPFYTVFNSSGYMNFAAWDFDAPLWNKEAYKGHFPLLYVDKRNEKLCETIMQLSKYARFEATGEVRSTFNQKPWIEIMSLKILPDHLNMESIRHIAHGYHYKAKEDHLNAVLEFSKAWKDNLPHHVKIMIRKEEGKSLFALGMYADAKAAFNKALDLMGKKNKDPEVEFLLKEAVAMAEYEENLKEILAEEEEAEEVVIEEIEDLPIPIPDEEEEEQDEWPEQEEKKDPGTGGGGSGL